MPRTFDYLSQDSELTLREGLAEYMAGYSHLNKNDDGTESGHWFWCHDCTHVLFGTVPFQIRGEMINDAWTITATDMTIKKYMEFFKYVDYDVVINSYKKIYKNKFRVYLKMFTLLPVNFLAMYRGMRTKKKWPWYEPEQYLDKKLCDLREEFGIRVIKP